MKQTDVIWTEGPTRYMDWIGSDEGADVAWGVSWNGLDPGRDLFDLCIGVDALYVCGICHIYIYYTKKYWYLMFNRWGRVAGPVL